MKPEGKKKNQSKKVLMTVVNPNAAGIDCGSRSHFVCVSQDNVIEFGSHTQGLNEIKEHLKSYGIKTVAIESTGFYWQQLFIILQSAGFEVFLVNARHIKNVKGHKTDVVDSKWLQLLHSIGLLENSFQPDAFTKEIRQYARHRRSLIQTSSRYVNKMNKSLTLMNIQLKTVLSDLSGASGLKVIKAIVEGERLPEVLEKLVGKGIKATRQEILLALKGDWRNEHLFELAQNYEGYLFAQKQIEQTDKQIEILLKDWESKNGNKELSQEYSKTKHRSSQKNDPKADIRPFAFQMAEGVDLSQIEGVSTNTIFTLMTETGFNLTEKFKTAKHFASWLGLAPNRKITGGKTISSHTTTVQSPLSYALRQAANAAGNGKGRLGDFFRKIAFKNGRMAAIVATARKIAVIIYKMLEKKEVYAYNYSVIETLRAKQYQLKNIQKKIKQLNIKQEDLVFC
jgi:transposase